MKAFCAAVDWGTSRFRIWILAEDGCILAKANSDEGLALSASIGFEKVLETHLAALGCEPTLPVIICGMAGSRNGWKEAGYLSTPIELSKIADNSTLVTASARVVHILPGIAQRDSESPDVMRGEETQLFGLFDTRQTNLPELVCMPGTHSKWVMMNGKSIRRFSTFMTGELFSLLCEHSVLKIAIKETSKVSKDDPAFVRQFHRAMAQPDAITAQLFSLRSAQLLAMADASSGLASLSGCLIGIEFAGAFAKFGRPDEITLLATGNLGDLYECAFEQCAISVTRQNAEKAGMQGLYRAATLLWPANTRAQVQKGVR